MTNRWFLPRAERIEKERELEQGHMIHYMIRSADVGPLNDS